jgi:exo-beta-1,3-glucanase (GH17 family)
LHDANFKVKIKKPDEFHYCGNSYFTAKRFYFVGYFREFKYLKQQTKTNKNGKFTTNSMRIKGAKKPKKQFWKV